LDPVTTALHATLARARRATAAGDDAAAIRLLEQAEAMCGAGSALRGVVCAQLGVLCRHAGRAADAFRFLLEASEYDDDPALLNLLGLCLMDDGSPRAAAEFFRAALAGARDNAGIWVNYGNAQRSSGQLAAAHDAFLTAIECDPEHAPAFYNLHAVVYSQADPSAAAAAIQRAHALRPSHVESTFFAGCLWGLLGVGESPDRYFEALPQHCEFMIESYRFVEAKAKAAEVRFWADTCVTLAASLRYAPDGLMLELGVRRGTSLAFLASAARTQHRRDVTVHGFDAFEGLPNPWGENPSGMYSTGGVAPLELPENARVHAGWFEDSLPPFVEQHTGPIAFVNVDCDLYSSTYEALSILAPRFVPGTTLVFDEYLCNPGWEEHEHRALSELAREHDWQLRYRGFSLFSKQATIQLC